MENCFDYRLIILAIFQAKMPHILCFTNMSICYISLFYITVNGISLGFGVFSQMLGFNAFICDIQYDSKLNISGSWTIGTSYLNRLPCAVGNFNGHLSLSSDKSINQKIIGRVIAKENNH